jgi:hypothetical protein
MIRPLNAIRLLALIAALAGSSACFRATTSITVRPDGTGTIDQEIGISAQAKAMMASMAAQGGDRDTKVEAPFGPDEAKKIADAMGVRFVSGEPIKTADLEGYRAHYAFDDISKVRVARTQAPGAPAAASAEPPFRFELARKGPNSVLTIVMATEDAASMLPKVPGAGPDTQNNAQALAMMGMMLRGLFIDVSLKVDGRIVRTTAPFVDGSTLTLFQMDFDKLLAAEGGLAKLQQMDASTLKDLPGVKFAQGPKIEVEFSR